MAPIATPVTARPRAAAWVSSGGCFSRTRPRTTVRALIRLDAEGVLLPTAKLVFTTASGEPVSEVALEWDDANPQEAGLRAILDALRIAKRYRPRHLIIYIDDEPAAAIASGRERAPASLVGLALQVRALLHTYSSVDVRCGPSSVAPTLPELEAFMTATPQGPRDATAG